jgi:hypothetical protein
MSDTSSQSLSVDALFAEREANRRRDREAEEQLQRRKEEELAEFRMRLENLELTEKVIQSGLYRRSRDRQRGRATHQQADQERTCRPRRTPGVAGDTSHRCRQGL